MEGAILKERSLTAFVGKQQLPFVPAHFSAEHKRHRPLAEVEQNGNILICICAQIGQQSVGVVRQGLEQSRLQGRGTAPQQDEPPVEVKNRIGIFALQVHIAQEIIGMNWQPGLNRAKTGIGLGIPLHGSPAAITAFEKRPVAAAHRVFHILAAYVDIPQTDFLAVINIGRPTQG